MSRTILALALAGSLLGLSAATAVAQEHEVRTLFAPYGRWAGLAAAHVM